MNHINKVLFVSFCCIVFTACKKDAQTDFSNPSGEVSAAALSQIKSLGFSTEGVKKIEEGYLVEGDIILTPENLLARPNSPTLLIANEEQYRTNYLVSASKHPTITVALTIAGTSTSSGGLLGTGILGTTSSSPSPYQEVFSAAVDEAIKRYNAESLTIKFQRVSSNAKITISAYSENSNTLASAGFPSSTGDPYKQVKINTYPFSSTVNTTNINFIATILAHELGHCIGFRHTDYMNRAYSCGGLASNEGSAGVGAIHIPGTPTGPDAASWMLSCIARDVNRPFNANDKLALSYIY